MQRIKKIVLVVLCTACLSPSWAQVQVGQSIYGEAHQDESGTSVSMPDAHTVAIGAPGNDANGSQSGQTRVYGLSELGWQQKGQDIDGVSQGIRFGTSVSMPDANTVAIGAPNAASNGANAGQVRVYTWNGVTWQQQGQALDGESAGDHMGHQVCLPDAQTLAVAAPYNDGNGVDAGHVRVYTWNGASWQQKGQDIDGAAAGDLAGWSVDMPDAQTVAIGAQGNDDNGFGAGQLKVYAWNGTAWQQQGQDLYGDSNSGLGSSVSMPDANTVAVGAYAAGVPLGLVRLYGWNGSTWLQQGQDIEGMTTISDFGWSVSMPDPLTLAVGAKRNSGTLVQAGQVRVYRWNGSDWLQKGIALNGDAIACGFGTSVSMPDSNTVAIGGTLCGTNGDRQGVVKVYSFGGTTGIAEAEFLPGLSVMPNPFSGSLVLALGAPCEELVVVVRNSLGQEVLREQHRITSRLELNVLGSAGLYFVELRSQGQSRCIKVAKE